MEVNPIISSFKHVAKNICSLPCLVTSAHFAIRGCKVCVIIISRVAYHIFTTKKHLTFCHRWIILFVVNELRKLEKPVTRAAPAGAVLLYMQKVLEVFYG